MSDCSDLTVNAPGGGVVERAADRIFFPFLDKSDLCRNIADLGCNLGKRRLGVVDETALEEQITRRVAAEELTQETRPPQHRQQRANGRHQE